MLPGYTTCRTGLPSNIRNDKDVNPPTSKQAIDSPETAVSSATYTSNTKDVLLPDADRTMIIPSVPTEFEKPDSGKENTKQ